MNTIGNHSNKKASAGTVNPVMKGRKKSVKKLTRNNSNAPKGGYKSKKRG